MYNTDWIEIAKKMYQEGRKYYQIARELCVDRKTVSSHLRECGCESDQRYVRKVNPNKLRKYNYSYAETVFEKIDTEEKAYWLGFLYADGYISKNTNTISLALAEVDKKHLEKFRSFLKLDAKKMTKKYKTLKGKIFLSYEFAITNLKIKEDLIKLGCIPRKTFKIDFPSNKLVPARLKAHFIRGYFDGDGSISPANKNTSLTVEMLGTENFLNGYQQWVNLGNNKLHSFKSTNIKHSMYGGFFAIEILDRLYDNATIFLERKHNKYLELRRLRLMTVRRPKSIIAEFSEKGLKPNSRLKALLKEAAILQQCNR